MTSVCVSVELLEEKLTALVKKGLKACFETDNVLLFIPNIIDYMRLLMLVGFVYHTTTGCYNIAVVCYVINFGLDELDGRCARYFGQTSVYGMMLDILLDEASILCLGMALSTLYPGYIILFQLYSAIDFSAQWATYQYSALYKNNDFHASDNWLIDTYFNNYVLSVFWVYGNHIFLLSMYLCNFTIGPEIPLFGMSVGLWQMTALLSAPWSLSRLAIMVYLLMTSLKNLADEDRIRRIKSRCLDANQNIGKENESSYKKCLKAHAS